MKALVIEEPYKVVVKEVPKPIPADDELLVRVAATGFCGSDIHIFKGEHISKYPTIPGHEFSGIVEACGEKVVNFKPGDHISADPNIFCENCDACKNNHQIHCKNLDILGSLRDGAFAEYVTVPERCAFHIGNMDLIQASMCEPFGCVINSHNKFEIPVGGRVLIMGAGTIGLMQLIISKRRGAAQIVMIDIKDGQLKKAKDLGADVVLMSDANVEQKLREIAPEGFEIIIDATGVPKCVEMGVRLLKYTGAMIVFGACPTGSKIEVDPFDIFNRDLRIIGSYALQKTLGQSIAMLTEGGIDLKPVIGQVITLADSARVFKDFVDGKTCNKIIVKFDI